MFPKTVEGVFERTFSKFDETESNTLQKKEMISIKK